MRYLVRSGGGWRMLPLHFGPWQTVYGWFRELARRFLFQTVHDVALMLDRERSGREASPSAAVIDSQSVKAVQAKTRGYDAGKKIVGRKRHIAVDTDGRLLMVNLTTADISDSAGAQAILDAIRKRWPWVKHLFADGAYDRLKLMDKAAYLDFVVEIIRRSDDQKGFEVLRVTHGTVQKKVQEHLDQNDPNQRGLLQIGKFSDPSDLQTYVWQSPRRRHQIKNQDRTAIDTSLGRLLARRLRATARQKGSITACLEVPGQGLIGYGASRRRPTTAYLSVPRRST